MLFRITDDECVFDINPEIKAIPEFAKLDDPAVNSVSPDARDRRMRFVILYADKKSPLRTLPDKQRREQAARIAGYHLEEGKRLDKRGRDIVAGNYVTVEAAIKKYREIQFDEDEDILETKRTLIQKNKEYIRSINNEKDPNRKDYGRDLKIANEIASKLPDLVKSLKELEEAMKANEPKTEIKGIEKYTNLEEEEDDSTQMSFIDRVMMGEQK